MNELQCKVNNLPESSVCFSIADNDKIFDKLANESAECSPRSFNIILHEVPESFGYDQVAWDRCEDLAAIQAMKPVLQ